jgi:NAD(P)-dependent dehydrogenase (short-subunit alcohol dehydrogenase family)
MRQQRYGRIINFSSTSGIIGNTGQFNYGAAKAAIAGFTRVLAKDLGRYGITANAIAPGAATRMTQSVPDSARQLRSQAGVQTGRVRAAGAAERVRRPPRAGARGADGRFLASDDAWNINGQCFNVSLAARSASRPTPSPSARSSSRACGRWRSWTTRSRTSS